ncbi:MAG: lipoprotein [Cycloclasticus sp.]
MMRFLRVVLILSFIIVSTACGQKGSLYLPSEQVVNQLGL